MRESPKQDKKYNKKMQKLELKRERVVQELHKQLDCLDRKQERQKAYRHSKIRRAFKIALLGIIGIFLCFVTFGLIYIFGMDKWESFDAAKLTNIQQTLLIYDKNSEQIAGLYDTENRINVPLSDIPVYVRNAFLAAEDARFYDHPGFDIIRIFGALWEDIKSGSKKQGASTISQQLIKMTHLTSEKKWSRKVQEVLLAIQLENQYTKDEIFEIYLNYVYFGNGAYGLEAAAQTYFGKSASQLTVAEGALLAGVIKAPTHYAPHIDLNASIGRRNLVLELMQGYGMLTSAEVAAAKKEKVTLVTSKKKDYPYGFYTEYVLDAAKNLLKISSEDLLSGGYRVYTSLDTNLQTYCEELFKDASLFPDAASDGEIVQGALVLMDPSTHEVVALVGGRDREVKKGFNRAAQLVRQPGSTIKPVLVYAPAIEKFGYNPASMILDEPTKFGTYEPENFDDKYYGFVTLRQAVTKSLNVSAVKILSDIGISSGKSFAMSVGIDFDENDNNLSLALGGFTYGISPVKLCSAYTAFASGGSYAAPTCIKKICNSAGEVIYEYTPRPKQVMSKQNAYILNSMLQSVVSEGTGKLLGRLNLNLAGKTGTTGYGKNNKDAWMVAYNSEYVATVWMGFDNTDSTHYLSAEVTGGTYPAELLTKLFGYIYTNKSAPNFQMPEGVSEVKLDAKTLETEHKVVLANALTPSKDVVKEVFNVSSIPQKYTEYWVVPTPAGQLRITARSDGKPIISFSTKQSFVIYRLYRKKGNEAPKLIGEYSGAKTEIVVEDESAEYGIKYEYYVVPVHPELSIGDEQVEGPESTHLSYQMPAAPDSVSVGTNQDETLDEAAGQ